MPTQPGNHRDQQPVPPPSRSMSQRTSATKGYFSRTRSKRPPGPRKAGTPAEVLMPAPVTTSTPDTSEPRVRRVVTQVTKAPRAFGTNRSDLNRRHRQPANHGIYIVHHFAPMLCVCHGLWIGCGDSGMGPNCCAVTTRKCRGSKPRGRALALLMHAAHDGRDRLYDRLTLTN